MLECVTTKEVKEKLDAWFAPQDWVFGVKDGEDTKKIWVINFALYKAHLIATLNNPLSLWCAVRDTCRSFSHLVHDFAIFNND